MNTSTSILWVRSPVFKHTCQTVSAYMSAQSSRESVFFKRLYANSERVYERTELERECLFKTAVCRQLISVLSFVCDVIRVKVLIGSQVHRFLLNSGKDLNFLTFLFLF